MVPVFFEPDTDLPDWALVEGTAWVVGSVSQAHRWAARIQETDPCSVRLLLLPDTLGVVAAITMVAIAEREQSREQDDPTLAVLGPHGSELATSKILQASHQAEPWIAEQRFFLRDDLLLATASEVISRVQICASGLFLHCLCALDQARWQGPLCLPQYEPPADINEGLHSILLTQLLRPGDNAQLTTPEVFSPARHNELLSAGSRLAG